eukprot:365997-Chlamydomonas_euryale.AAC.4
MSLCHPLPPLPLPPSLLHSGYAPHPIVLPCALAQRSVPPCGSAPHPIVLPRPLAQRVCPFLRICATPDCPTPPPRTESVPDTRLTFCSALYVPPYGWLWIHLVAVHLTPVFTFVWTMPTRNDTCCVNTHMRNDICCVNTHMRNDTCCVNTHMRDGICCLDSHMRDGICCLDSHMRGGTCCLDSHMRGGTCGGDHARTCVRHHDGRPVH